MKYHYCHFMYAPSIYMPTTGCVNSYSVSNIDVLYKYCNWKCVVTGIFSCLYILFRDIPIKTKLFCTIQRETLQDTVIFVEFFYFKALSYWHIFITVTRHNLSRQNPLTVMTRWKAPICPRKIHIRNTHDYIHNVRLKFAFLQWHLSLRPSKESGQPIISDRKY